MINNWGGTTFKNHPKTSRFMRCGPSELTHVGKIIEHLAKAGDARGGAMGSRGKMEELRKSPGAGEVNWNVFTCFFF